MGLRLSFYYILLAYYVKYDLENTFIDVPVLLRCFQLIADFCRLSFFFFSHLNLTDILAFKGEIEIAR